MNTLTLDIHQFSHFLCPGYITPKLLYFSNNIAIILTHLHIIIYSEIITDKLTDLHFERIDIRSVMHNLM